MQEERRVSGGVSWGSLISVVLGLAILGILLLTPIKSWLNRIPNLWRVVYPLMVLFAGALLARAVRAREGVIALIKWIVLLAAALSATLYAYDGPRLFFNLGRWGAFLFIVIEVVQTLVEGLVSGDGTEGQSAGEL
jgi:hypothetical protein